MMHRARQIIVRRDNIATTVISKSLSIFSSPLDPLPEVEEVDPWVLLSEVDAAVEAAEVDLEVEELVANPVAIASPVDVGSYVVEVS